MAAVLDARFYNVQTISPITKIVGYIKMLLFPFAFCYAARLGLTKFIFIVFTYIYVNYVSDGYISRGEIVSWIIILSMVSIFIYDVSIKKIALISSLLFIPMVIFFQAYTKLRLGGDFETVGFIEALLSIIESQSQVSLDGVDLIASGYSFAILDYLKWLFTLPIPKVILPDLGVVNISHSASSDLLGLSPNDKGFFVLLPGYIAESVYIFGLEFYWLSAVVSSLIFVFIIRFLSSNECSYPFVFYIFVVFSYNLSRAGVTSSYPIVLNQLLLMYLFLLYRQVKR
nr:hypothetical protein [uncultured Vibrio sp.]